MHRFGRHTFGTHTFAGGAGTVEIALPECGDDLMKWGHNWLKTQLQTHAAQPIIYQRGNAKVALCATFGRKLLALADDFGVRMEWTDKDFLIPRELLILSGQTELPKRGDQIKVRAGTETEIYEVNAPDNEPVYKWSDPYRSMLRVHTKRVGVS